MRQYLGMMEQVMANGVDKQDRTGTGTRSVFGHQMRFDLNRGFPMVTTKFVPFKLIATELLWFLQGNPDIRYLHEHNNHIWDEWRRPYSTRRPVAFVEPRVKSPATYSGDFNYGSLGVEQGSIDAELIRTWTRMMKRCYDPTNENYRHYGGRGVTVAKEWHDPKVFLEQARCLPHWWYKQKDPANFELDKDYYGSNQYGPDTCVWLHRDENKLYMRSAKPIVATTDEGIERLFVSLNDAARELGMSNSTLSRFVTNGVPTILKRDNKRFLGWEFKEREVDGRLPRLELIPKDDFGPIYGRQWRSWPTPDGQSIDQIANVIERLKTDPDNRRLIVSAWNVAAVESGEMALPPCHAFFQFYSAPMTLRERANWLNERGADAPHYAPDPSFADRAHEHLDELGAPRRKLSCQLYQRSADTFLGVPFNIASYALLTHMIAQVTNHAVGDFVWTGGDVHIYSNHFEQVKTILDREPLSLPELILDPTVTDIDAFTIDHMRVEEYHHHGKVPAPVAV